MASVAQILRIGVGVYAIALAVAMASGPVLAQANDARAPKGGGAAAAASADAGLKSRVDALEEQLVDMQVVVGTLESLTKNGGGSSAAAAPFPSAGSGADTARIDSLETQVRALTAQVTTGELFTSFGHNQPAEGSATAEFMLKVDEVRKSHPQLSDQQAYARAYDNRANAEIVKRMRAEAQG